MILHKKKKDQFFENGFELDTLKKYTFALVEEKWVFIYIDFSKIAVLFLWILLFVFFCGFLQQKMIDFG